MWERLTTWLKKKPEQLRTCVLWLANHGPAYSRILFSPETPWKKRASYMALGIIGAWSASIGLYALLLIPFTPGIADLKKAKVEQPSVLLSADGKELMSYKQFNREWMPLDQISPHVVKALIATEDHRFYKHHGIDFLRTASAAFYTITGNTQGGSTITQQLARNLYPDQIGRSPTLTRKLKEAITALKIEYAYSKTEILETYLNTVPFLYNAWGIEMASRTYFDKSAADLNVLESATLIGMLKGTSYYNPVRNPNRALERRNVVLGQMLKHEILAQAEFNALKKKPLKMNFERQQPPAGLAPHFSEHIRKWFVNWADRHNYNIYTDGLIVHSTIDSRLQKLANQAMEKHTDALQNVADVEWGLATDNLLSTATSAYSRSRQRVAPFEYFWKTHPQLLDTFIRETQKYQALIDAGSNQSVAMAMLYSDAEFISALQKQKTRLEAGFSAIDPQTGFVKVWVGGRDFDVDRYDHVAQARRQPGSTFKAFVYGAALEDGMSPEQTYYDKPVEIQLAGGGVWRPSDVVPPSGRRLPMEDGLIHSKNAITAQVIEDVGPTKVAQLAKRMGVKASPLDPVLSLALGTSPVALMEMVSSYATIAALGEYRRPQLVTRITDKQGNVLASFSSESDLAMDKQNALILLDMMRGVVNRGSGVGIRQTFGIRADVAGKTGTTQNNTDGWFILMHPQLVAGAWVGFNDPRIAMRSVFWGQGAHNALYLVGDFFRQAFGTGLVSAKVVFPERPSISILKRVANIFSAMMDSLHGITTPDENAQQEIIIQEAEKQGVEKQADRLVGGISEAKARYEKFERQIKRTFGEDEGPGIE